MSNHWDLQRASETYNIRHWGGEYFHIGSNGNLHVHPQGQDTQQAIDLYQLVDEIQAQGLSLPVLVRFGDILHHRVNSLCQAFAAAMDEYDYQGGYTAAYPIKVNQQHTVVEEIYQAREDGIGLEAGSKPELMVVMAQSRPGGTIICNGYKDREYIRLALIGLQLGLKIYIVIEKLSELQLVLSEAENLNVEPLLGLRIRLASIGAGKWQNSGGEKSKFGLTVSQAITMVDTVRQHGLLDSIQLLHFHLGSQLANIHDIQQGMNEAARHYAELRQLGVPLQVVDVGGGLGIDYEGTRSRSECSVNYTLQEYANKVVHTLFENCEAQGLPHPHIITESGRAMTAHHAVLITDVIDAERVPSLEQIAQPGADEAAVIHELWRNLDELRSQGDKSVIEAYHDAVHGMNEAQGMYVHGVLNMQQRAQAEAIYHTTCHEVRDRLSENTRQHQQILEELNEKLADKVFCNFSLFQSLPDIWAINQVFPIMPLHRLQEEPQRRVVLHDITCDSDGRIDYYVDGEGVESSLPMHHWHPGERYLVGFFLVGAYQEILGDMHNLFGDTDSVNVVCSDDGYRLTQAQQGDTVDSVLRFVNFEPRRLMEQYRHKVGSASLNPELQSDYLAELEAGLSGYTYLEE